ncbi:MAG: hypothetical protein JXQ73_17605 [Phycisphaerae bacterium]|nr:hypothetical protein [Phycisphaerae bacterium]
MRTDQAEHVGDAEATSLLSLRPSEVPAGDLTRVLVVPWGDVASTNGRFIVDAESARRAVEAFEAQGNDLPIDYEHQTLGGRYSSPTGQAPAAGWIKRLEAVEGVGIVAHVEWTEEAAAHLTTRQYRYLSPVVIVGKEDRRLVALHSAGLTNKPAITGMRPIVNRSEAADRGTDDGNTERIQEERSMQTAWDQLRQRLGLDQETDEETVLLAASRRLEAIEGELVRGEAEDLVAGAMKAGKLTAAQKEWAIGLILRDRATFETWLSGAPVIVPHGQVSPPEDEGGGPARHGSVAAEAKREYAASDLLRSVTSEEAYVANALREAKVA